MATFVIVLTCVGVGVVTAVIEVIGDHLNKKSED